MFLVEEGRICAPEDFMGAEAIGHDEQDALGFERFCCGKKSGRNQEDYQKGGSHRHLPERFSIKIEKPTDV